MIGTVVGNYQPTKQIAMKKLAIILISLFAISLASCIQGPPGPDGYDGNAYVAISYDDYPLYSYWDNNPDVPNNPAYDYWYPTYPGQFDFEYFVNRTDYWYGTYDIWVNRGGPGRPNGQAGRDGYDTYLTLVCNADGPYEMRKSEVLKNATVTKLEDGSIQYTFTNGGGGMRVTMKKTTVSERPAHDPKLRR